MAQGILGLGSSGSVDLNQDLIDKLKETESNAYLKPISTDIEETQAEIDATDEVATKISELLQIIDSFDLYSSGTNVFDEVSATTSGSSVNFSASDTSNINPGTISVSVTQLAQKDVYQSDIIADPTAIIGAGTLSITVGGTQYDYDTTDMSYEDLVTQLNYNSNLDASLEQVGDNSYRLILKSSGTGLENAITITQDVDAINLVNEDVNGNNINHVVEAQNLLATIDGTDYDLSSNKVTLQNGLSITAVDEGDSSISVERDDTLIVDRITQIATTYNELVNLVSSYTTGDEENSAVISDSSTLRSIMSDIKDVFYDSYGLADEENAFIYGISFNKNGQMEVDTAALSDAVTNNYDDLKELFVGYAEKEGIGTRLSSYLDDLDSLNGTLTTFQDKLSGRLSDLNDSLDDETERIDTKYQQLADQFAQYTVIISQMENSFKSLQLIMDMQTSNNS